MSISKSQVEGKAPENSLPLTVEAWTRFGGKIAPSVKNLTALVRETWTSTQGDLWSYWPKWFKGTNLLLVLVSQLLSTGSYKKKTHKKSKVTLG